MDGKVCCLPRELQYQYERGKISCRRLEWEGGAVSSRVALLLRSAEAQPYLPRFVWIFQTFFLGGVNVRSALCTSMGLFPKGSQPLPRATRLDFWTFSIFRLFPKGSAFASRTTFGKSPSWQPALGRAALKYCSFFEFSLLLDSTMALALHSP